MTNSNRTYTVSELNAKIRSLLEGKFPFVQVSGEISTLRRPYSGHLYFTIKDADSQLKAVLFKMQQRYLSEPLEDGKHVICKGRISVYEPRGDYQLLVDSVDFAGTGILQAEYEKLKRRLAAEGLFAKALKRPIPKLPNKIALVTSPGGAAVHDFINVATRRWPSVHILVCPVAVQGDRAAPEMIEAIRTLNAMGTSDVIVICRGGGSIEDLWAFNNEQLARTIRASTIPTVSAVGHEIDFTIADFVADLRAPTPSGAAELITPDRTVYVRALASAHTVLHRALQRHIRECEHKLSLASRQLSDLPHPLDAMLLKIGQLSMNLEHGLSLSLQRKTQDLQTISNRLAGQNPEGSLPLLERRVDELFHRLVQACRILIENRKQQIAVTAGVLDAVSPLATLARGYAVAKRISPPRKIVTDASQVACGDEIELRLHRGKVRCKVK